MAAIDEIPWGDLDHHYGKASDVPRLLGAIRSGDPEVANRAAHDLENALYHQGGWVGSAASAALPFILEIASDRAGAFGIRLHALTLVGELAEVAATPQAPVDADWASAWQESADELSGALLDPHPRVRRAAAVALSCSPLDAHVLGLIERVRAEPDGAVRLDLRIAASRAATLNANPALIRACRAMLDESLADPDPMVQLAALHGLGYLDPDSVAGAHAVVVRAMHDGDLSLWEESDWGGTEARTLRSASTLFAARPAERTELLLQLLDLPLSASCRQALVTEAAEVVIPHRRFLRPLVPLVDASIRDPSPDVRLLAVHLVAAIGRPLSEFADICAELTVSPAQPSRAGVAGDESTIAVWALARFRDPRAVPALVARQHLACFGFDGHSTHYPQGFQMFWRPGAHEVIAEVEDAPAELVAAVGRRLREGRSTGERRTMCQIAEGWGERARPLEREVVALIGDREVGNFAAKAVLAMGSSSEYSKRRLRRSSPPDQVLDAWLRAKYLDDFRPAQRVLPREPVDRQSMEVLRMIGDIPVTLPDETVAALEATAASSDDWLATLAANALCLRLGATSERLQPHARVLRVLADRRYLPVMSPAIRQLTDLRFPVPDVIALARELLDADWRVTSASGWRACVEDEQFREATARYLECFDLA